MGEAAAVFLTLGIMLVGFGLMSLGNVLNLGITRQQREHGDLTSPRFQLAMVRFMVLGAALMAIGGLFAVFA